MKFLKCVELDTLELTEAALDWVNEMMIADDPCYYRFQPSAFEFETEEGLAEESIKQEFIKVYEKLMKEKVDYILFD